MEKVGIGVGFCNVELVEKENGFNSIVVTAHYNFL